MALLIAVCLIYYGASLKRLSWPPFVYVAVLAVALAAVSIPERIAARVRLGEDASALSDPANVVFAVASAFLVFSAELLAGHAVGRIWRRMRRR
jgi:hypothetical protein